jgi:hypothetical protein
MDSSYKLEPAGRFQKYFKYFLQNCMSYKIVALRAYIQAAREALINIGKMAQGRRY